MKKSFLNLAGALLLAVALCASAKADPISGSLGFAGSFTTNSNSDFTAATSITFGPSITIGSSDGDYAGIPNIVLVNFNGFSFDSLPTPDLWDFSFGGKDYSFTATSVNVSATTNTLTLSGEGVAHITGLDDTHGNWVITSNTLGNNFSFSASTAAPDGGTTALLVGLGLAGMGFVSRRRK